MSSTSSHIEAAGQLLGEVVAERRQVGVGDVQHADLVAPAERVGLDRGVRARGAGHHPPELLAEVAHALDRALDGTEQLRHQPERAG